MSFSWESMLGFFSPNIRTGMRMLNEQDAETLEEVRLRINRPIQLVFDGRESFLCEKGVCDAKTRAIVLSSEEGKALLERLAFNSVYAFEEELRSGFITLPGGFRVGICGQACMENGKLKLISNVASFNVRISRQKLGAATKLLPYLLNEGSPLSTLIISPPGMGKTTILRDLARQLSDGLSGVNPVKVSIVDERSEIAGCLLGVPQNDIGSRSDVFDGCPKQEAIPLLVRAMSPSVIVTDEIGKEEDMNALIDAACSGVVIMATAHGGGPDDIMRRPILKSSYQQGIFRRYVFLSRSMGVGTIEYILDDKLEYISKERMR